MSRLGISRTQRPPRSERRAIRCAEVALGLRTSAVGWIRPLGPAGKINMLQSAVTLTAGGDAQHATGELVDPEVQTLGYLCTVALAVDELQTVSHGYGAQADTSTLGRYKDFLYIVANTSPEIDDIKSRNGLDWREVARGACVDASAATASAASERAAISHEEISGMLGVFGRHLVTDTSEVVVPDAYDQNRHLGPRLANRLSSTSSLGELLGACYTRLGVCAGDDVISANGASAWTEEDNLSVREVIGAAAQAFDSGFYHLLAADLQSA